MSLLQGPHGACDRILRHRRKGYHIVWEAVPAWVCTQCSEPFFEASEVESIQRALVAVDRESVALVA